VIVTVGRTTTGAFDKATATTNARVRAGLFVSKPTRNHQVALPVSPDAVARVSLLKMFIFPPAIARSVRSVIAQLVALASRVSHRTAFSIPR